MDSETDFFVFPLLGEARLCCLIFLVAFSKFKETCETFLKMFLSHVRSMTRILTQTMKVMNFELFEVCEQIPTILESVCINNLCYSFYLFEVRRNFRSQKGLWFIVSQIYPVRKELENWDYSA